MSFHNYGEDPIQHITHPVTKEQVSFVRKLNPDTLVEEYFQRVVVNGSGNPVSDSDVDDITYIKRGNLYFKKASGDTPVAEAFNATLTFNKNKYMSTALAQSGPIAYTLAASGNINGKLIRHKILSDGSAITFPSEASGFTYPPSPVFEAGKVYSIFFTNLGDDIEVNIPAAANASSGTISGATLNDTNTVDITFSRSVYSNSDGTGALVPSDLAIANFVAGGATALSISSLTKTDGTALVGGETVVRCVLSLTGKAYGNETFEITPSSGTSIYDSAGAAIARTQTTGSLTLHPTGYDYLTSLQVALDDIGLATGVTNKYGVVDASNNVTKLKTIYPSALKADWNLPAGITGVTLNSGVNFDGIGYLTANGGTDGVLAKFVPMHYSSAGITDIQTTYHWVCKLGNVADPNAAYALVGTNGTASSKVGVSVFYDDRSSVPNSNAIRVNVTNGAGYMVETKASDVVTPNTLFILTVEVDGSITTVDRVKVYINGVLQTNSLVSSSETTSSANPSHLPDLGAAGGGVAPMVGTIRSFAYTLALDTATNRDNYVNWLKGKYGIV